MNETRLSQDGHMNWIHNSQKSQKSKKNSQKRDHNTWGDSG